MAQLTYLSKAKYLSDWRSPVLSHTVESGIVPIFSSKGSDPLKFWETNANGGTIKRTASENTGGLVTQITSPAFCRTYISLPEHPMQKIGTSLPFLTLLVEYMGRPFCFEVQVRDNRNMKRRFRLSTCQNNTKLGPLLCHMPLKLNPGSGWNKIGVDLQKLTKSSYDTYYAESLGIQIYANCRLQCVYFSDRRYEEEELPDEYRLKVKQPRCRPARIGQDVPRMMFSNSFPNSP